MGLRIMDPQVANKVGISNEQTPVQFIREAIYHLDFLT